MRLFLTFARLNVPIKTRATLQLHNFDSAFIFRCVNAIIRNRMLFDCRGRALAHRRLQTQRLTSRAFTVSRAFVYDGVLVRDAHYRRVKRCTAWRMRRRDVVLQRLWRFDVQTFTGVIQNRLVVVPHLVERIRNDCLVHPIPRRRSHIHDRTRHDRITIKRLNVMRDMFTLT